MENIETINKKKKEYKKTSNDLMNRANETEAKKKAK